MANEIIEPDNLKQKLKMMHICRFCLSQRKLSGIFVKSPNVNSLAPSLTVQIMACASIEIFSYDGMPSFICQECRVLFEHAYRFKQMCKRADTLLRQYPLTGQMPKPLIRPKIPPSLFASQPVAQKILNLAPATSPEAPLPLRFTFKNEPNQDEIHILNKVGNDEEISMEDVQMIIQNAGDEDFIYANNNASPPKLLNKTTNRTLTIDLEKEQEPQLSKPKMQMNTKGHMEMVTAIVQPSTKNDTPAKDPVKVAEPVATDNFPCPFCERSFPLLQLRDIHLTRHNRERNFQCPDCDKSFFSKYDLQKHEVRHTGERPFKCQICEKSFTRLTLLHRHERVHTDVPKYMCMYCEKPFISKDELETHIVRHEKNRPFKCQECGKSFAFKQGLERHEVVHSAVLPYPCQYCDQSFTTPSKLSRHLNAHAGDRPFPCKYCNKSYLLSHHLTRHLRSHKQEKSSENRCTDCKKSFNTNEALIYHTAVHSTANLICTLCQMKFNSANEVAAHIKQHIDGETYACEFCDLLFLSAEELLTHYDAKHSTEVEEFKYNTNGVANQKSLPTKKPRQQKQKQQQQKDLTVLDGDDQNVTDKVAQIIESKNSKQQQKEEQLMVLDGDDADDENVMATINKIFHYDDSSENETAKAHNEQSDSNKQQKSPEKPTILNQIVFNPSNLKEAFESPQVMASNDNNEAQSAKKRKVIARDGKLQVVEQGEKNSNVNTKIQRKVAEKPAVQIKIEKEDSIVGTYPKLPTLPKGVTLRKTSAANNKQAASGTSPKTSPEQKPVKKLTLAEAQAVITEKRAREAEKAIEKPVTRTMNTRRSGGNNSTSAPTENKTSTTPSPSTSKPQQQKSQKIKQIRMTKAMADELAKQGRIKFKDGNMILTKPSK